jgi:tetratricopeptide (TPR) repeat protein
MTTRARTGVPLALMLLLSLTSSAWACLWYYGTDMQGKPKSHGGFTPAMYIQNLTDDSEHRRRVKYLLEPKADERYKARSDMAATLVYQGQPAKAIEILKDVEKEKPGEYVVAANLGTAYELHGDLESARQWIAEAMKRNKDAHYGTEWLHVLILDARMALAKDPKWLETHSVLGVDFGKDPAPKSPWPWPKGQSLQTAQKALEYQLHERMGFVPAPDPVVGDLLFDLGNVVAMSMTAEHAIAVYDLALTYKPPQADLVARRRAHFQEVVQSRHTRETLKWLAWIGGGGLFLGLCVFWVRRRARAV